ncbi:MAG TPA: hypothetical protein PK385_11285 [Spirochaetota bacterium]|nr:hypothetical protein [Spirochaetota bacterium]HOS33467.1 hypothetical protein [Spirochaetota bacterium]HOS56630.1 hypothetical protein [Spirochaetota bacterium]HPK62245.1 hypothetical protein [Spirochaetota bacterium]HQF78948.1 hypothetical protein [Spirochaetota bacterium]
MQIEIDVYHLANSRLPDKLSKITASNKSWKFNFYDYDALEKSDKKGRIVILEEEDSYISCVDVFDAIVTKYSIYPTVIIFTVNRELYNVVRWMRRGAADCLWMGDLSDQLLKNSFKSALNYIESKMDIKAGRDERKKDNLYEEDKIELPQNYDWDSLKDGENYEMTLLSISAVMNKDAVGIYSKATVEKIYEQIRVEISAAAAPFGGKIWFWNNNGGMLIFHFGDNANLAALFSLYFANRFFLLTYEKLKLDKPLNYKMSIDSGKGLYHKTDTGHITSELLNFTVHIQHKLTSDNEICITERVYSKLSGRIRKYFAESEKFQDALIYKY